VFFQFCSARFFIWSLCLTFIKFRTFIFQINFQQDLYFQIKSLNIDPFSLHLLLKHVRIYLRFILILFACLIKKYFEANFTSFNKDRWEFSILRTFEFCSFKFGIPIHLFIQKFFIQVALYSLEFDSLDLIRLFLSEFFLFWV